MQDLESCLPPRQEVVYQVIYSRLDKKTISSIGCCIGASYLCTQSPIVTIAAGILSTIYFAQGAVGHASLLTAQKKISTQSSFSVSIDERSKIFEAMPDDLSKNPRMLVRINATDSQIQTIESSKLVLSTTCSHGSSRLLAKAGLPHAFFPISLSPTLTGLYLENKKTKDNNIQIKYLNWDKNKPRTEIQVAVAIETFLTLLTISAIAANVIPHIYNPV